MQILVLKEYLLRFARLRLVNHYLTLMNNVIKHLNFIFTVPISVAKCPKSQQFFSLDSLDSYYLHTSISYKTVLNYIVKK